MPLFEQYPLMAYLKKKGEEYFWKVQEVRKEIPGWLGYIKETFPHYTDHTERHSEEIVRQISKLLFTDEDVSEPVIQLSAVEAYILVAAAFFHDAGMVASNAEKEQILTSDAWKDWTTGNGDGAERWQKIRNFREGPEPRDVGLRNFLADIQVRHLIAEFIRRQHHARAAIVIEQYQNQLGRFAFDDRQLQETISKVCVAHGLRHRDLEDSDQYPYEQDISGETVNIRLMAILLRLGDLLDMSSNRACPLFLNAASPLPADSLPHWTQYQRIDRQTRPGLIEIRAKCKTQDEHRVLQDWCQWLVDETQHAYTLMARSTRHANWRPPFAKFEKGSIIIEAAEGANYIPSTWKLQLDQDVIFKTLIEDRYDDRSFIRELIKNALDATRCQMYADLVKDNERLPEYPTQVDENRRNNYTLHIGLRMEKLSNRLPGEPDERQIFSIEDLGIGMDRDIIQRYLLQIGRSFYTTDEFARSFRFFPTSRSGMGFLSVFKVSNKIIVETRSRIKNEPLRMTLTSTKSYPLTEHGGRDKNGTKIEVHLRDDNKMKEGQLTELITDWCKRVEFPIVVDDLGNKTVIRAERPEDFTREVPDPSEEGAKFIIKAFPINHPGLEGELYVLTRVSATGAESWFPSDDVDRERGAWQAERPRCPGNLVCLHGIGPRPGSDLPGWEGLYSMRLDYRGSIDRVTLSRSSTIVDSIEDWPAIMSRWEEILSKYLATTPLARCPEGWKYKQRLIGTLWYRVQLRTFWASQPETIRVYLDGTPRLQSLNELRSRAITTVTPPPTPGETTDSTALVPAWDNSLPTLIDEDIAFLSTEHYDELFRSRCARNVRQLTTGHVVIDWEITSETDRDFEFYEPTALSWTGIGFVIHPPKHGRIFLNTSHHFVQWMKRIRTTFEQGQNGLKPGQEWSLFSLVRETIRDGGSNIAELIKHLDA